MINMNDKCGDICRRQFDSFVWKVVSLSFNKATLQLEALAISVKVTCEENTHIITRFILMYPKNVVSYLINLWEFSDL